MFEFLKRNTNNTKPAPKRKGRRKLSLEEQKLKLEIEHQKYLQDGLHAVTEANPDLKVQMLAKAYNFNYIPPNDVEKRKEVIRTKLYDAAIAKLEKDPNFLDSNLDGVMSEFAGEPGRDNDYSDMGIYPKSGIREFLDQLDEVEELKERMNMGGNGNHGEEKSSFLMDFLNSEAGQAIAVGLLGIFGGMAKSPALQSQMQQSQLPHQSQQPHQMSDPRRVQLNPGGNDHDGNGHNGNGHNGHNGNGHEVGEFPAVTRRVTRPNVVRRSETIQPVQPEPIQSEIESTSTMDSEIPADPPPEQKTESLDLQSWIGYMDREPWEFVAYLLNGFQNGEQPQTRTVEFLMGKTVDELLGWLQFFKMRPEFTDTIAIIEHPDNREWLDMALALLIDGMSEFQVMEEYPDEADSQIDSHTNDQPISNTITGSPTLSGEQKTGFRSQAEIDHSEVEEEEREGARLTAGYGSLLIPKEEG